MSMLPVGFEPATPAGEWPQTYALDRSANGTGVSHIVQKLLKILEGDKQTKNYLPLLIFRKTEGNQKK